MTAADAHCPIHADLATQSIVAREELAPQFASCIHCVESLAAWRDLRELGGSLDWTPPDALRSARVRARVVRSMSSPSSIDPHPFRGRLTAAAIGMAAVCSAVLLALVATHSEKRERIASVRTEASLGVIQQIGVARFERTSEAPDEVVRLKEGRVRISVAHLAPTERFRIVTSDAVVEVRGTKFDVQASSGRLQAVAVERGLVEVRVGASEPAVLAEGARWSASKSPIAAPPAEPMPPAPGRIAHAAEAVLHRKEGVSSQVPPAASRSMAGGSRRHRGSLQWRPHRAKRSRALERRTCPQLLRSQRLPRRRSCRRPSVLNRRAENAKTSDPNGVNGVKSDGWNISSVADRIGLPEIVIPGELAAPAVIRMRPPGPTMSPRTNDFTTRAIGSPTSTSTRAPKAASPPVLVVLPIQRQPAVL